MKRLSLHIVGAVAVAVAGVSAWAQGCESRDEIPAQSRTASESAAKLVFDQASRGDITSLKANAIPSLQANFTGIRAPSTTTKQLLPARALSSAPRSCWIRATNRARMAASIAVFSVAAAKPPIAPSLTFPVCPQGDMPS